MALPDLAALRVRVRNRLRDSEAAFVPDSSIDQWVNEAYLDLNARLRINKAEATGTASASGVVTLPGGPPSDVVEIINLWFDSTDVRAEFTDDFTFNWYANQSQSTGNKVLARIGTTQDTVETYPAQADAAWTLEYIKRPALLANGTDKPTVLTEELSQRLTWYAIAEAKYQEGELEDSSVMMARYVEGLPGAPREMYRRRPQSLSLIPEQGPFD